MNRLTLRASAVRPSAARAFDAHIAGSGPGPLRDLLELLRNLIGTGTDATLVPHSGPAFVLSVETTGEAFQWDGTPDPGHELAVILRRVANELEAGCTTGYVRDSDGQPVGSWSL